MTDNKSFFTTPLVEVNEGNNSGGPIKWVDYPSSNFGRRWTWGDTLLFIGLSLFLFIIPGAIYLIVKIIALIVNKSKRVKADKAQDDAIKYTDDIFMSSMLHLGGHPYLPFNKKVVVGLNETTINFYDYSLREINSLSYDDVIVSSDIRQIQSTSYGTTYTPNGSNFGSTVVSSNITMRPDTIKMGVKIQGHGFLAEFDPNGYQPLEFITDFNNLKAEYLRQRS